MDDHVPADVVAWLHMKARVLKADKRLDHARAVDAAARIADVISEFWIAVRLIEREDAVAQAASIAAEVLPSGTDSTEWAERVVPPKPGQSAASAMKAAFKAEQELLRTMK